jgi:trk system potassium uptake protein
LARYRDPVVVVGLGRFGSALALELARRGTEVLAIDSDEGLVQRMAGSLAQVVAADATDLEALKQVGVPDFTKAVVAIGADQEASILATSLLADLGVDEIWAKALSAQHARILERVGAHHVVQPEHEMGERVAHLISGRLLDWMQVDTDWVMATTQPPQRIVGTPLGQTRLRSKHGVTVVSVKPAHGTAFTYADTETVLAYGDRIVIAGRPDDIERFVEST